GAGAPLGNVAHHRTGIAAQLLTDPRFARIVGFEAFGQLAHDTTCPVAELTRQRDDALRCPPLSCRTSPPRGGRSGGLAVFANRQRGSKDASGELANLPPRGGDVRQDRGGREGTPDSLPKPLIFSPPRSPREPGRAWPAPSRSSHRKRDGSR